MLAWDGNGVWLLMKHQEVDLHDVV
ncbi:hypothetical protein [Burkholderia sp. NLJ2]